MILYVGSQAEFREVRVDGAEGLAEKVRIPCVEIGECRKDEEALRAVRHAGAEGNRIGVHAGGHHSSQQRSSTLRPESGLGSRWNPYCFGGDVVGEVYQGNQVFNVRTILDSKQRRSTDSIAALPIRNDAGIYLTLGQVANVYETSGRFSILHDGARRVQTITANVSSQDVGSFVADARRRIQQK